MGVAIQIDNCNECPYWDHSGSYTPGGAKPVCQHSAASTIRGKGLKDKYHWKHRVLREDGEIPLWCPVKAGIKHEG